MEVEAAAEFTSTEDAVANVKSRDGGGDRDRFRLELSRFFVSTRVQGTKVGGFFVGVTKV